MYQRKIMKEQRSRQKKGMNREAFRKNDKGTEKYEVKCYKRRKTEKEMGLGTRGGEMG